MTTATTVLLYVSAAAQTLFVLLWGTRPWWREWIGRALMLKAFSLAVYLDWAVAVRYWPRMPHLELIGVCLFGFITVGIVTQLAALGHEMWRWRVPRSASVADVVGGGVEPG